MPDKTLDLVGRFFMGVGFVGLDLYCRKHIAN